MGHTMEAMYDMLKPNSATITSKLTDTYKYQPAKSAAVLDKLVEKYRS